MYFKCHETYKKSSNFSDWSKEVLELCKEFKGEGVVGIDLAGQEFHPGVHPDDCAHKRVFAVSSFLFILVQLCCCCCCCIVVLRPQ